LGKPGFLECARWARAVLKVIEGARLLQRSSWLKEKSPAMIALTAKTAMELPVEERKARLAAMVKDGRISAAAAARVHFVEAPPGVDEFARSLTAAAEAALARGRCETA
jgi:hypothetical protein